MKNNSKLLYFLKAICMVCTIVCVVCTIVCVVPLLVVIFDGRTKLESILSYGISLLFGGFLSSIIISWYYFYKGVKEEIATVVEKTKKDVKDDLNKQFKQHREFLNNLHNKSKEVILRKYKDDLVNRLENDMAKIWDIRPGANTSATRSQRDSTAINTKDNKYYKMFDSINKHSEDLFNSILNGKSD